MLPLADEPLFFLDYDGTLAPIVDDPAEATPHPRIPPLLEQLDARFPLWIVTGRDLEQLVPLIDLPLQAIGLHGAQRGVIGQDVHSRMPDEAAEAMTRLRSSLPSIPGIVVEEKSQAFAVHYRNSDDEQDARRQLRAWTNTMPDTLEAIWGKKVVELRPDGLTKGTAVREIADEFPERTPVYLGDDVTDEDAFQALHGLPRRTITAKVGEGDTCADYRLAGPSEVADYLSRYVDQT
jgi:trehalose 6-phosphate phosphatase